MPQRIHHRSHPDHSLTLLPVPAYREGSFDCDACGLYGAGFSYHCYSCGIDFHGLCANDMPLFVSHAAHMHPLSLVFFVPYDSGKFSCDICTHAGANQWLYRCAMCNFDAHTGCAMANPTQLRSLRSAPTNGMPLQQLQQQQVMIMNGSVLGRREAGGLGNQIIQAAAISFASQEIGKIGQSLVHNIFGGGGDDGSEGGSAE